MQCPHFKGPQLGWRTMQPDRIVKSCQRQRVIESSRRSHRSRYRLGGLALKQLIDLFVAEADVLLLCPQRRAPDRAKDGSTFPPSTTNLGTTRRPPKRSEPRQRPTRQRRRSHHLTLPPTRTLRPPNRQRHHTPHTLLQPYLAREMLGQRPRELQRHGVRLELLRAAEPRQHLRSTSD